MTMPDKILVALLIGPMGCDQLAKSIMRQRSRTLVSLRTLRERGDVMSFIRPNHHTPTYALTRKGLNAAKELL